MRLHKTDRDRIKERLNNDDRDALVACNIIEVLSRRIREISGVSASNDMEPVSCDFITDDEGDPDHFRMQFTKGVSLFSHAFALMIDQVSDRIIDIQLLMTSRIIEIIVVRASAVSAVSATQRRTGLFSSTITLKPAVRHEKIRFEPRVSKRRRIIDIDYAASGVIELADQRVVNSIVDDVYQSFERIPANMIFWFEVVRGEHGAHLSERHGGAALPFSDDIVDDSVSESVAGGDIVGFSLCFSGVPDISFSFLQWLHKRYPTTIASSYAWLHVPNTVNHEAMFVINVRHINASIGDAHRIVQNSQPRGISIKAKRVRV